jgi:hypothetical protein
MARLAVRAVVNLGHLLAVVIALDMLPGLTSLTEDGVAIIILKGADAFDGVGLVIFWLDRVGDGAVGHGGVQRGGDRIRVRGRMRGCEVGGICHNLTAYLLSLTQRGDDRFSAPKLVDQASNAHDSSRRYPTGVRTQPKVLHDRDVWE